MHDPYLPRPNYTHRPMCSKVRYDKKAAESEVKLRTTGRHRYRHGRPAFLRCYFCERCQSWHLTHKEKEL